MHIALPLLMTDAEQLARIAKLRAIGWSQQEIADELGLSRQVVAYQLQKLKKASKKKGPDEVFQAALLGGMVGVAGGLAIVALAEMLSNRK